MNNKFSDALLNRLKLIQELQIDIINKFGEEDYNIFLFGSFLTERYVEGESDIDLAVYTPDFNKYLSINFYLDDYFREKNISRDIFYIDIKSIDSLYCAPLTSVCRFTDYYPKELDEFYNKIF